MSRRSSSGVEESESTQAIFDEFGAFEQAHEQQQITHLKNENIVDVEEDEEREEEEIRRICEQMKRGAIPTQKNSPGISAAAKEKASATFKQESKTQEPQQKASPRGGATTERSGKAVGATRDEIADDQHSEAEMDPMSSAALSRMRYYRKLIPAPKPRNTSPKSESHRANHLPKAGNGNVSDQNSGFVPPSQSAAAVLYQSNRSLPIAIPLRKLSPSDDDSHRFRTDLHPRIAADSSFILPAASYLPSLLQKSFVPHVGSGSEDEENSEKGKKHRDSLKDCKPAGVLHEDENDQPFGFEFEMDM